MKGDDGFLAFFGFEETEVGGIASVNEAPQFLFQISQSVLGDNASEVFDDCDRSGEVGLPAVA